jgi:hypothetical protein
LGGFPSGTGSAKIFSTFNIPDLESSAAPLWESQILILAERMLAFSEKYAYVVYKDHPNGSSRSTQTKEYVKSFLTGPLNDTGV